MTDKTNPYNIFATMKKNLSNNSEPAFAARMEGVYRFWIGKHDDPTYMSGEWVEGGHHTRHEGSNHAGVYDYLTLGIPWAIESFGRANWNGGIEKHPIWAAVFAPIWVPPNLIRAAFGGVTTLLALPFVGFYHLSKSSFGDGASLPQSKHSRNHDDSSQNKSESKVILAKLALNELRADQLEANQYYEIKIKGENVTHEKVYLSDSKHKNNYYCAVISESKEDDRVTELSVASHLKAPKNEKQTQIGNKWYQVWKNKEKISNEKGAKYIAYIPKKNQ